MQTGGNKTPIIDIKKHGGKQVAIADGKIVAEGNTLQEVLDKVKEKMPSRSLEGITVFAVPKTSQVIYTVKDLDF